VLIKQRGIACRLTIGTALGIERMLPLLRVPDVVQCSLGVTQGFQHGTAIYRSLAVLSRRDIHHGKTDPAGVKYIRSRARANGAVGTRSCMESGQLQTFRADNGDRRKMRLHICLCDVDAHVGGCRVPSRSAQIWMPFDQV